MKTNILVIATALSDQDLLARLEVLASKEREASAELVAHLAELDSRPALYAARGYGSLFTYCTQALRLSEDAACSRIEAARACRRFPLILELLASGSLTLTSVRLLARHLTVENHQSVLAKARKRTRREIEALVAELAPRPDLPSAVRKLPCPKVTPPPLAGRGLPMRQVTPDPQVETSVPSACCRRRPRSPSWRRRPSRGQPGLSVPGRIESADPPCPPAMCRGRSSARSTGATLASAPSWRPPTEMHGAHVTGVPPHPCLCAAGAGHRRQHLTPLLAPQPTRSRADLPPGGSVHRP